MTSKEALNELYEFALSSEPMKIIIKDFKDIILQDLEVLEHLKLLFNGFKVLEKNGIKYKNMYLLCKNSSDDLVKEWLENV